MAKTITFPCTCGGTFRQGFIKAFDATTLLGYPVIVEGKVPALVCDQCRDFMAGGKLLALIVTVTSAHLLTGARQLSGDQLRFLRRNLFLNTQEDFAARLGISRRTLIRWEESASLGAEADFMVRAVCTPPLLERINVEDRLREIVRGALSSTRSKEAPRRAQRFRFKSSDLTDADAA